MIFQLHARQSDCFLSEATEILYGGAAGGGKSHTMRVIALNYALSIKNIQIYLFRRLSEDLKKNHLDGASGFNVLLAKYVERSICKINYSTSQIVFKNGAKIHLCHCQHEKDVLKYQGVEINILLIDELTHFSEYIYKFLRSRVRLGSLKVDKEFENTLPKIIASSNPGGVGHEFVKNSFIDNKEAFKIYQMSSEEGGMKRQFIPAKLADNPTMLENDPFYADKLQGLGGALAKAMLEGDWNAIEGAFFDKFDKTIHVIESCDLPAHWTRIRAFDWGYSRPFCVLWGAVSDGTLISINGVKRSLPVGSIVIYREFYGCTGKPNEGLKMEVQEIAERMKEMAAGEEMHDMVADPAIFDVSTGRSIAEQMMLANVAWRPADNKRINGWQQIRTRLKGIDEKPMLYFFDTCKNLLRTLPLMQYDRTRPEDIDTNMEDHAVDTLRYLCMTRPIVIENKEDLIKNRFNPHQVMKQKLECQKQNYDLN